MKFLLDANLSPRTATHLRLTGFDVEHLRDRGIQTAEDVVVLRFAREHGFVLISEDTDFGELLARERASAPSFVPLRPQTPDEYAVLLADNLPGVHDELAQGAIVVIARDRLRVRTLPLPLPAGHADES